VRILLVEDDWQLGQMYQAQLERAGHNVCRVESAQGALDVLENQPVDAILLDVVMPKHNGLSLLQEIRSFADWQRLPAVLLSSLPQRDLAISDQQLKHLGVKRYLNKAEVTYQNLAHAFSF
jgi:DNA-binding response OmpR family regulator